MVELPSPPATCDWYTAASTWLHMPFGNTVAANCVVAGGDHICAALAAQAGNPVSITEQQCLDEYSRIQDFDAATGPVWDGVAPVDAPFGYVSPGYWGRRAYDLGAHMYLCYRYWREHGFLTGGRPIARAFLDAADSDGIRMALYLFGNVHIGQNMRTAWFSDAVSEGFLLQDGVEAPKGAGDHVFSLHGYTEAGPVASVWGKVGVMEWNAISRFCRPPHGVVGELCVYLCQDWVPRLGDTAPNGYSWDYLVEAFNQLYGTNVRRDVRRGRTWRRGRR